MLSLYRLRRLIIHRRPTVQRPGFCKSIVRVLKAHLNKTIDEIGCLDISCLLYEFYRRRGQSRFRVGLGDERNMLPSDRTEWLGLIVIRLSVLFVPVVEKLTYDPVSLANYSRRAFRQ